MRENELEKAHIEESKDLKMINVSVFLIPLCASLILPYFILGFFGSDLNGVVTWLSTTFPILEQRINFLKFIDNYSHLAFAATLISSAMLSPLVVIIMGFYYWRDIFVPGKTSLHWRNVIAPGKSGPLTFKDHQRFLFYTPFFYFGVYIIFVFTPTVFHPDRLGMAFLLFWPVFPGFGSVMAFYTVLVSLNYVFGGINLILLRRGRNG